MTDLHARPGPAAVGPPAPGEPPSPDPRPGPRVRPVLRRGSWWGVLAVLVVLGSADVVVAALLPTPPGAGPSWGYEVAAVLGKLPVLAALAVALRIAPALSAATAGVARTAAHRRLVTRSVRLVVPVAAVVGTIPPVLLAGVLPWGELPSGELPAGPSPWAESVSRDLPWTALTGVGLATTVVLTLALLALRAWFLLVLALAGASVLVAEAMATGLEIGRAAGSEAGGLAGGAAVGAGAGAVLVATVWARRRPRRARLGPAVRRGLVFSVVVVGVLTVVRPVPGVWLGVVVVLALGLAAGPLLTARVLGRVPAPTRPAPGATPAPVKLDPHATLTVGPRADAPALPRPGLRILHLAADDPDAPGAGTEAHRAAEIDRRLAAAGHRITVVCRRHRGAVDRTEHHRSGAQAGWVQWVHPARGSVGYALAAGICARDHDADLVVEELAAPLASVAVPRWTTRPVLAVAGWFDVDAPSRRLRDVVRRWAIRSHRTVVAVSVDVAEAVARIHPRADVVVIGHGVRATAPPVVRGDDVVCTAPLHVGPKGLDLLLDAWARLAADLPGRLVLTGTGPQDGTVRARIRDLGLDERVVMTGVGSGPAATEALAAARVAVVPSRYEASGVAALTALAAGTPVVASDLPVLREVLPAEGGVLVPHTGDGPGDAAAFARALWALYSDDERRARAARWGPEIARGHDWDTLAGMQEDVCRGMARPAAPRWQ